MRNAPGQRMLFDDRVCCLGCGKILTNEKSIARLYGPSCLKRKKRRNRKKHAKRTRPNDAV
jgi:hypothetical protein